MKNLRIALIALMVIVCSFLLVSCFGGGGGRGDDGPVEIPGGTGSFDVTITFDPDGGSEVAPVTVPYASSLENPPIPTKEGYEFIGWYSDTTEWDYGCFQDMTVTAWWRAIEYSITYTIEGPEVMHYNPGVFVFGNIVDLLPPEEHSMPYGYEFSGWFTDAEYTNPITTVGNVSGNIELFAKVSFNPFDFLELENGTYSFRMLNPPDTLTAEEIAKYDRVEIPATYNGKPVTEIANSAFYAWSNVTEIIIPEGILGIGGFAFSNTSITSLDLPESLLYFGQEALREDVMQITEYEGGVYAAIKSNPYAIFLRPVSTDPISSITIHEDTKIIGYFAFNIEWYPYSIGHPITELILPDSVKSICYGAFRGCDLLVTVDLGGNVEYLGGDAFYGCSGLEYLDLGSKLEFVDSNAFFNCDNIKELTAPIVAINQISGKNVTVLTITGGEEIGIDTLADFKELTTLKLCDSITSIHKNAFESNTKLTDVEISTGVTSIEALSFIDMVYIPKTLYNGAYYIGNEANPYFILHSAASSSSTTIEIHQDTKFIWHDAFSENDSLEAPVFPDGIIDIGNNAFSQSTLNGWSGTASDGGVYYGNESNPYMVLVGISSGTAEFEMNEATLYFSPDVFKGTSASGIVLPVGITEITEYMFANSNALERIVIPDGVTKIGDYAFSGCTALQEISVPDSVVEVGRNIVDFKVIDNTNTGNLTPVYSGPLYCDGKGFYLGNEENKYHILFAIWSDSTSVTDSYKVKDGTKVVAPNVLRSDMYEVILPDSVKVISDYAFGSVSGTNLNAYSESLGSIVLGNSVEYIGDYAFNNCVNLKGSRNPDTSVFGYVVLPDSLTYLGEYAFSGCEKLVGVSIGTGLTEIKEWTFSLCYEMTSITIPDNVKSIGDYAFWFCAKMKTIRIGSGTEYIGDSAFVVNFDDSMSNYLYDGHAYCAASSKPEGWNEDWISENVTVSWNQ